MGHWLFRHKTNPRLWKIVPSHCHDRLCTPCQASRSATICQNLAKHLQDHPHRLLTLTIRSNDDPLTDQLNRLLRAFRRLRRDKLWTARVTGGLAFVEITWNPETTQWHPHLHAILDGAYIPKPDLNAAWLAATGDSNITHITLVRSPRAVSRYVTKYATKAYQHAITADDDALDELVLAVKSRRTVIPFGAWRRWRLLTDDKDKDWRLVCHSAELDHAGPAASDDALAAWSYARTLPNWAAGLEFDYAPLPP